MTSMLWLSLLLLCATAYAAKQDPVTEYDFDVKTRHVKVTTTTTNNDVVVNSTARTVQITSGDNVFKKNYNLGYAIVKNGKSCVLKYDTIWRSWRTARRPYSWTYEKWLRWLRYDRARSNIREFGKMRTGLAFVNKTQKNIYSTKRCFNMYTVSLSEHQKEKVAPQFQDICKDMEYVTFRIHKRVGRSASNEEYDRAVEDDEYNRSIEEEQDRSIPEEEYARGVEDDEYANDQPDDQFARSMEDQEYARSMEDQEYARSMEDPENARSMEDEESARAVSDEEFAARDVEEEEYARSILEEERNIPEQEYEIEEREQQKQKPVAKAKKPSTIRMCKVTTCATRRYRYKRYSRCCKRKGKKCVKTCWFRKYLGSMYRYCYTSYTI